MEWLFLYLIWIWVHSKITVAHLGRSASIIVPVYRWHHPKVTETKRR